MATIRERGPYQWQAQVIRKGHPAQYKTFNNKTAAERWARLVESEMDKGVFVSRKEAESTTLSDAIDRFIDEHLPTLKTQERETNRARAIQRDTTAKHFLATIRGKDIADFIKRRKSGGAGPKTIKLDLSLLSKLFNLCMTSWGMESLRNPVELVQKPKLPRGRDRRLKPGELDRILEASASPALSDLVRFALETAMRRGELAGMTWDMVDLKRRTVTLPETKNGEKRIVPLSSEAVRILSGLTRRIDGKVWGMADQSITQAFIRAVSRARAAYEKECEENGRKPDPSFLSDLTFHDLRHEATSRFFEKGFNPMEVSAITGHKTLQMLKRYTHLKAEDLAERLK